MLKEADLDWIEVPEDYEILHATALGRQLGFKRDTALAYLSRQNFLGTNRRLIGARNWLGLTFDENHNIWAEWYVEGKEVPYTKVIR